MKIISWNVAGLRACLKKGLEEFFYSENADIFCIQESKLLPEQNEFHPEGYFEYLYPAVRKGYSGTLIYSKQEPISVKYGIDDKEYDDEGRTITLEFDTFYLVTVYVPNIKRDLSRMESRMRFQDVFKEYLINLSKTKNVIVCGDFNVAHEEIDIKNVKSNVGNAGFIDTFRYYNKEKALYTWWSYMGKAREKDVGWRIDYFLVNNDFIDKVKNTMIYTNVLGSDHCPIGIEI